jgi:hypothetical protein
MEGALARNLAHSGDTIALLQFLFVRTWFTVGDGTVIEIDDHLLGIANGCAEEHGTED